MASSIESKLEKFHSLCLVLGEDFEELSQKELGGPPYNHQYSTNLDLLLERKSDLKNFRLTEARSLASRVLDYWDVLSVPVGERKGFTDLFCWIDSVPNDLINEPCQLSSSVIQDMIAELDRVEDICMDKLSEQLKVLDECKKLAGLYVPKPENHQSIQEDDDYEDPIASLRSVTAQIEGMKKEISSRGSIVTRAVIVLNAVNEVNWFQSYNYRAQALSDANHDMHGRAVKAQKLSLKITEMLDDLKDKVEDWKAAEGSSFMYNGGDLSAIVVGCKKKKLTEAPEVAINLQLHPAHMEDPEVQIDPQPQQFEAPADGGVIPPHNPIDMDVPRRARTRRVPVEPHQPARAGPHQAAPAGPHQPAVAPHQAAPAGPHQPVLAGPHQAAPAGPHQPALAGPHQAAPAPHQPAPAVHEPQSTSESSSPSEDGDDSDDSDYVP